MPADPTDIDAVKAAADLIGAYGESKPSSLHLTPDHYRDLKRSGLNTLAIDLMRVKSVRPQDIAKILNNPAIESLLEFPYPTFDDQPSYSRWRIYPPLVDAEGHKRKYHQLPGTKCRLYFLEPTRKVFADPRIPLVVVEGEKKSACAFQHGLNAVGIGGVWNWCNGESGELIEDFNFIAWVDRPVDTIFDSNIWVRQNLGQAAYAF